MYEKKGIKFNSITPTKSSNTCKLWSVVEHVTTVSGYKLDFFSHSDRSLPTHNVQTGR
jgi:hypothetical protein